MAIYTVHEPPARPDELRAAPERLRFVRDGFHFWAFVVPLWWMLWHRLWLVLICYLVVVVALNFALRAMGLSTGGTILVNLLFSMLIGLEAGILRRWTLGRRGWQERAVISADRHETAERRFFDNCDDEDTAGADTYAAAPAAHYRATASHSDIIGLFPQPGASR